MAKASGVSLSFADWPSTLREGALFQALGQEPKTRTVKIKDFESAVAPINKDKERSSARIFSESLTHQTVEPVKAFTHVAGFQGHEDFQAPAKAQHPLAPSRPRFSNNTAASPPCRPFLISRSPPPSTCTHTL